MKKIIFLFLIFLFMHTELVSQNLRNYYSKEKPTNENSSRKNYMYEDYNPVHFTIGLGLGTIANDELAFKKSTYNIEIEGKIFASIDYLSLGFGGSINLFPEFNYDETESNITINIISSELIFYTEKYKGLFFSASLSYPIEIDDSDYFSTVTLVAPGENVERTKFFTPSYGVGFAFETAKGMREISISYRNIKYRNEYRSLNHANGLNFYRTDTLNFAQIQLTFKSNPYKVF